MRVNKFLSYYFFMGEIFQISICDSEKIASIIQNQVVIAIQSETIIWERLFV